LKSHQSVSNHPVDFTVQNHGSIFLLCPHTEVAHEWVNVNIGDANGYQPYWPTVVIEHRYVADIIDGISSDGLEVCDG